MSVCSVILPTYNEGENISDMIEKITGLLAPEIIVVDDDSPDGSWKNVEEIAAVNSRVRLLRRTNERGVASAISEGISVSKGDYIVWMDSDFSMPPEIIPRMIETLQNCDIAVGSRYLNESADRRNFTRVVSSRIINTICRILLDRSLTDYTSGFIAVKREVLGEVGILKNGHGEYFIPFLINAKKRGFVINEIPYTCNPRRAGRSKTFSDLRTLLRHSSIYFFTVIKVRFGCL